MEGGKLIIPIVFIEVCRGSCSPTTLHPAGLPAGTAATTITLRRHLAQASTRPPQRPARPPPRHAPQVDYREVRADIASRNWIFIREGIDDKARRPVAVQL